MEFVAKVHTWFLLPFYGAALFMFAGALIRSMLKGKRPWHRQKTWYAA